MGTETLSVGALELTVSSAPGRALLTAQWEGRTHRLSLDAQPEFPGVLHRWLPWTMRSHLCGVGLRGDAVAAFWRRCERAARRAHPPLPYPLLRPAELAVGRALHCVIDALDGSLLAVAKRFAQALRWAAYRAMASDRSGRVRQLAESAPGVLAFALAHARRGDRTAVRAVREFLGQVVAGVPLRRAAWPLLLDWWDHGARRRRWRDAQGPREGFQPGDQERRCREQYTLLRMALPSIAPDLLWLPAPLVFIPEDVPRERLDQERWFAVMKGTYGTLFRWTDRPPEAQRGFVAWLSRTAISTMGRASDRARETEFYVRRTGVPLRRETNAHRFTNERLRWEWEHLPQRQRVDPWLAQIRVLAARHPGLACTGPDGAADLRLPALHETYEEGSFRISPLGLASELRREGQEMAHCVHTYLEQAAGGACFLYGVRLGEERLTLEVLGPAATPTRGQFLGRQNRPPSEAAQAALDRWWAQLGHG